MSSQMRPGKTCSGRHRAAAGPSVAHARRLRAFCALLAGLAAAVFAAPPTAMAGAGVAGAGMADAGMADAGMAGAGPAGARPSGAGAAGALAERLHRAQAPAPRGATAWQQSLAARVRLIAAPVAGAVAGPVAGPAAGNAGAGNRLYAGVEIKLEPGWKTYWRHPGDTGIAPEFDFAGSANVADISVSYPMPRRFDLPGDISFGYVNHVVFPLEIRVEDPAQPVHLSAHVRFGVCEEMCIPVETRLMLDLPASRPLTGAAPAGRPAEAFAEELARWQARVPARAGLTVERVAIISDPEARGLQAAGRALLDMVLRLDTPAQAWGDAPRLIVEQIGGTAQLYFGVPVLEVAGRSVRARLPVRTRPGDVAPEEAAARLRLTLGNDARAFEAEARLKPQSPQSPQSPRSE